jgi:hypothetical protein
MRVGLRSSRKSHLFRGQTPASETGRNGTIFSGWLRRILIRWKKLRKALPFWATQPHFASHFCRAL